MGTHNRRSRFLAVAVAALVGSAVSGTAFAAPAVVPDSTRTTTTVVPVGGPGLAGHGVLVAYGTEAEPVPAVAAKSWVLADLETGEIIAAKAPHLVRPPASTLKTLTALTLIPQLDPDDVYRARLSDVMVVGSRAGLVANAPYTVDDLWYALLLPSGNDAARALAHANGGIRKTVAEMNEVARHLQANDTVAHTPHGLDTPGQVSSAYDLALIARAAMKLEAFRTYVSTLKYDFPGLPAKAGKKRHTFELWNQNPLLREDYRGALGVKTGYTTMAGRTFVGAARRGDRTLVVTLMGVTEPTTNAAKKLLTWGFHEADHVTPVGLLVDPVEDPPAAPGPAQPVAAAPPVTTEPITPGSNPVSTAWPVARWLGAALVILGAVVGLLALRGRRRDERSRQRLIASARRAR